MEILMCTSGFGFNMVQNYKSKTATLKYSNYGTEQLNQLLVRHFKSNVIQKSYFSEAKWGIPKQSNYNDMIKIIPELTNNQPGQTKFSDTTP